MSDSTPVDVAARLREQEERLVRAARAVGRDPSEITLVAVSKRQDITKIARAYEAGQRDFGENYVQELLAKSEALSHLEDIRWHMIGHLQSNKARQIAPFVHTLHTVSSVKLARELAKRVAQRRAGPNEAAGQSGAPASLRVLIEVNVGEDPNKSGCSMAQAPDVADEVEALEGLELRGLMTVPPLGGDPEDAKPHFLKLAQLRDELGGVRRLPDLSMGMSGDLEVAIAAGATIVRVGTAIFGPRMT